MGTQAFDAKRLNAFLLDPDAPVKGGQCIVIGVDEGDASHPLYDKRVLDPLDENMVRNIMRRGVLQNINIVKDGDDRAIVVSGRRRVLHAREANKRLKADGGQPIFVPAVLRRGKDGELLGIFVSENEQRRADSITGKAAKAQRLVDAGYTTEEIAETFNVTTTTITANWLPLLDLDEKVRDAVDAGQISASAAAKLAPLSRAEQRAQLKEMLESGKATTAEAGRRARNSKKNEKTAKSGDGEDDERPKPRVRLVKRALDLEGASELDPAFVKGCRFMMGEIDPAQIKGLTALLREAETPARSASTTSERTSSKGKKAPPRKQ